MSELLRVAGSVAGLAGLAVGMIIILFREVIRKQIFPQLPRRDAYRLLRMIVVLAWSIAVLGIVAWVYVGRRPSGEVAPPVGAQEAAPGPLVVAGTVVDQDTNRGLGQATIAINGGASTHQSEDTGNFRIVLPAMDAPRERLRLRVTNPGYQPLERSILPPAENVILPLKKD